MQQETWLRWVSAEPYCQRRHRGDNRPPGEVERVTDQCPEWQRVAQRIDRVQTHTLPAQSGDCQLVAERLGHVELVEVRSQSEMEASCAELLAEQAITRSRFEQPRRVEVPDGRRVAVEPLARSAQRTGWERLGLGPVDGDRVWLLIESQPQRPQLSRLIRDPAINVVSGTRCSAGYSSTASRASSDRCWLSHRRS